MIVIEFVVFVVSSGLFYSGRFRHHLWAVLTAGGIATGSSLLFVYDLYEKLELRIEASVKVVRQVALPAGYQRRPAGRHADDGESQLESRGR